MSTNAVAVYQNRINRSWDQKFWDRDHGLLVGLKQIGSGKKMPLGKGLFHGKVAWAEIENQAHRVLVVFDGPTQEFVSREVFQERALARHKEFLAIKAANKVRADEEFAKTGKPPVSRRSFDRFVVTD